MKLYRDFTSQEEIDREYSVESSVPDLRPYMEQVLGASAQTRRELECVLDARFGPTRDETVDIFPAKHPGAAILLFIHGGFWRRFSSKEFSLIARGPVAHNVTVVVTNYSLCPKVSIAEITRQSRAVIAWLHREAHRFHGDPARIFVCGHSSGGHQVGMLAATDWEGEYGLPSDIIKGGIPISGLFDLAPFRYSWLQPKLLLTHEIIQQQSPLFHIPSAGPPLLVSVGEKESAEFHRQSADYLAAWHARGLRGDMWVQPGQNHFTAILGLAEASSPLSNAVIEFMARCEQG